MTTSQTPDLAAPMGQNQALYTLESLQSNKAHEELYSWTQFQYQRCKSARSILERQWYLNMAFFFGRQNVQILSTPASPNGFKLYTPPAPPWRVRLVTNKVRRYIRSELSRLTSQQPTAVVMPASADEKDLAAARVAEDLFDNMYQAKQINRTLRRALWWSEVCGTAFLKDYWDKDALDKQARVKGDILVEHVTPFHLFVPDLREEELENQPFVIHASTKTPAWVNYRFKDLLMGKDAINPNTAQANDILQDSFLNMIGANSMYRDVVLCLEVWVKAGVSKAFPNGGMFTILGDKVVQAVQGWPYKHNEYPFSKLDAIPSGKFYADSPIVDLIPLQREYNRTRSQIVEAKNRMAKPQLIAPRGSINPNQITTEPGQVILYTPGMTPPQPLQLSPMPQYVIEELNRIQADMDEVAGSKEFNPQQGAQIPSATAMSFIQEQADTMLNGTVDSLEAAIEKVGRHYLSHVSQFWTTGRIVKIIGRDGSFDAQVYKGEDIAGNHDLRVEAGSALPISKAAKQAFVLDLMKMGVIPPDKGLQVLELGGLEKVYNDLQLDLKQVRRENLRMMDGSEISVNSWDNHQIHIQLHNSFRKTQTFEALDDNTKALYEQHVQLHQQQMTMSSGGLGGQQPPPGGNGGDNGQPNSGEDKGSPGGDQPTPSNMSALAGLTQIGGQEPPVGPGGLNNG